MSSTRDKSRASRKRFDISIVKMVVIIRLTTSMTFGTLNDFIGSEKIDPLQPHIVLTQRNVLSHFRAVLQENQHASGSPKPVPVDDAITTTAQAILELFVNNGVTTVLEYNIKK